MFSRPYCVSEGDRHLNMYLCCEIIVLLRLNSKPTLRSARDELHCPISGSIGLRSHVAHRVLLYIALNSEGPCLAIQ